MTDKENTVSSDLIYTGKTLSLRVDTVEVPNKGYQKREIVEHNGIAAVLALTDDGKVILIEKYRKSVEDVVLEIPSWKLSLNENPKECVEREFKEKLGYDFENFRLIYKLYPSVEFSNQMIFIYLAKNIEKYEDKKEDLQTVVKEIDFDKVYQMALDNDIVDAKTSMGVLIAKNIIK